MNNHTYRNKQKTNRQNEYLPVARPKVMMNRMPRTTQVSLKRDQRPRRLPTKPSASVKNQAKGIRPNSDKLDSTKIRFHRVWSSDRFSHLT